MTAARLMQQLCRDWRLSSPNGRQQLPNRRVRPALPLSVLFPVPLTRLLSRWRGAQLSSLGSAGGGEIPESQIEPESALLMPGSKDNATIMVRQNGKVMVHVWSAADCKWSLLGEATGAAAGTGDTMAAAKKVSTSTACAFIHTRVLTECSGWAVFGCNRAQGSTCTPRQRAPVLQW